MTKLASDTAMVLAAGLGKRMRPLTASQPKPLVRVAGKALIDHALDRLAEAGVAKAVVNVHYLADALEAHVLARKAPQVTISDEREQLLETGGGLVKALPLLPDPFFCLNSDNIWLDGPRDAFHDLSQAWDPEQDGCAAAARAAPRGAQFPRQGRFPHGRARAADTAPVGPHRAVHLHRHPARFATACCAMRPKGRSRPTCCGTRAIEEERLYGTAFTGQWFEVGTPAAIAPTEAALKDG